MAEQALSERTHPLYDDNIDAWEFYEQSVKGGHEYLKGGHLFSHRLESQADDFEQRKNRAYYLNFCDTICSLYTNYIMKEDISRPIVNDLTLFRRNADRSGNSIDVVMKKAAYMSSYFGHVYILVDSPSDENIANASKFEIQDKELSPFCSIIKPTELVDWSVDGNGDLNWVLIKRVEYKDADPLVEREEIETFLLIDREKWQVVDEDGEVVDGRQGDNPLGRVYLVPCYHQDTDNDMIGESLIKDAAYINRIIYNWCSCIDEMIERQTFSQLVVPDDGMLAEEGESSDVLKKIGTSSIWTFPSDASQPPRFISPNTENINVIWDMIVAHVREIHRLAGLTGISEDLYTAQRSGKSQEYGFLNISTSLSAKARNLQRVENEVNKLVFEWMSKTYDPQYDVVYPRKFDVEGLAQNMADTFSIVEKEVSETLNIELLKKLSDKALPMATSEVKSKIESEIESNKGVIKSIGSDELDNGSGEVGRPAQDAGPDGSTGRDTKDERNSLRASRKTPQGTRGGQ